MDDFTKQVYDDLYNEFIELVKPDMTRKEFVTCYLGTFLGRPPQDIHEQMIVAEDRILNAIWKAQIKGTSLGETEAEFMETILEVGDENYIDKYIKIFNQMEELKECLLSELLIRCLEGAKKVLVTHNR